MHNIIALALLYLLIGSQISMAGPISGYLTDIGVTIPNAVTAPNSAATAWRPTNNSVSFSAEDSVGGSGFVGPGYGGQPYDLEALYVQTLGAKLFITGVSGVNLSALPSPSSGSSFDSGLTGRCNALQACYTFPIGDFFLGTGNLSNFTPVIGIEVTGQHYDINSSGYTSGWTSPLTPGSVVDVDGSKKTSGTNLTTGGFENGLVNYWGYEGSPSQLAASGYTGQSSSRKGTVTWETVNGHSVFQAAIDTSALVSSTNTSFINSLLSGNYIVHWGEVCGNDYLRTAGTAITEPSTISLLAASLFSLGLIRMHRRRSNQRVDGKLR